VVKEGSSKGGEWQVSVGEEWRGRVWEERCKGGDDEGVCVYVGEGGRERESGEGVRGREIDSWSA
jgi:hypothetical protein